jgi:hypothetical protein
MRHDPASGAIIVMPRSLKMHGMAQAVTDLMKQGAPAFDLEDARPAGEWPEGAYGNHSTTPLPVVIGQFLAFGCRWPAIRAAPSNPAHRQPDVCHTNVGGACSFSVVSAASHGASEHPATIRTGLHRAIAPSGSVTEKSAFNGSGAPG